MIRIHKPVAPPEILLREGPRLCAQHASDVEAGRTIEFDRRVYAAAEVTRVLHAAQHGKCCYCEKLIEKRRESDVEHFRPKAEVRQGHEHEIQRPAYYWLAYEWSNLYLACKPCNEEHKGILFPLIDPGARMQHRDASNSEAPMFIDPGNEDPEDYISFNESEVFPRDGNMRGDRTIRLLELTRPELGNARRYFFDIHRTHFRWLEIARKGTRQLRSEDIHDICSILARSTEASAPFAAMMRCHLRRKFGDDIRLPLATADLLAYVGGGEFPRIAPPAALPAR